MIDISLYKDRKAKIGHRIRTERKKINLSQEELAGRISDLISDGQSEQKDVIGQPSISQWEKGLVMPPVDKLACMAYIFDCDVGYLLCDYDMSIKDLTLVAEQTGLTYNAAKELRTINMGTPFGAVGVIKDGDALETLSVLSELIESPRFLPLMNNISRYLIAGGVMPVDTKESDDLSPKEYDRFMQWADSRGLGVEKKADICEMYLQRAADELKNMFREILARELKNKP